MGIYDRDYYRKEGPSFLGNFSGNGKVCKWLIGINVVIFIIQLATWDPRTGDRGPITRALWFDPELILQGQVWRMFTYAFLHDIGWAHILFNMLFLWWFGNVIEGMYGRREFLTMYVVAIFASAVMQLGYSVWLQEYRPMLGASGGVTAVMVIFAFHYPHHRILLWFFIPVPVWLIVAFQIAQDSFHFFSRTPTATAVAAHLGGALFGFLYYWNGWRLAPLFSGWFEWKKRRSKPRLRVYHEEAPEPVAVSATKKEEDADEHLEAQLDAVLEKLAKVGRENLTEEERDILLRASEKYRDKRT